MSASEVLEGALERLNKGWCQGHFALDEYGRITGMDSKKACFWCVTGAVMSPVTPRGLFGARDAMHFIVLAIGEDCENDNLLKWNDEKGRTKEQVIAAVTKARELALQKENVT